MEQVTGCFENGVLTVALKGHIDSTNAPDVEKAIMTLREGRSDNGVVLDAEELKYISSAGLRVVLRLRKTVPDLKVINVASDVYEVFEMTGFTEMMTVERAYRRVSVDGCEVIGEGANGRVYRIDADTIVKVYYNSDALEDIRRECELARKAFVLGIPTAISYAVVRVGDGYGSVFEMVNAKSFSKLIAENPDRLDEYIRLYVDLLKKVHATRVRPGEVPDISEYGMKIARFVKDYLPEKEGGRLVDMMAAIPKRDTLIHGDYHTKNVMLQDGEPILLDMDTLSAGHPVFELASMFLAFVGFSELDHSEIERFQGFDYETAAKIWRDSVRLYLGTDDPERIADVTDKARIIGYSRLLRRTARRSNVPNGQAIIENCRRHLIELIDRTDSLSF